MDLALLAESCDWFEWRMRCNEMVENASAWGRSWVFKMADVSWTFCCGIGKSKGHASLARLCWA